MNIYHDNEKLIDTYYNTLQNPNRLENLLDNNGDIYEEVKKTKASGSFGENQSKKITNFQENTNKLLADLIDEKFKN